MSSPRFRIFGLLAFAAAMTLLASCSKDPPNSPSENASQQDADDAAQQVGFMMSTSGGASPGSASVYGRASASTEASTSAPTTAAITSTDTTFVAGHVTWTISRAWFDVNGSEQAEYNPITTVRVHATARGTGTIETASDTASYGGAGTLDITGISMLQDTLTTNATRYDTLQCSFTPRYRTGRIYTHLQSAGLLSNVVQLKPVSAHPWPASGTATWMLKIDRLVTKDGGAVEKHFEVTVIVTFNGTQYADIQVSGGFRYKIDLQTGLVARV